MDIMSPAERSHRMKLIKSKDTQPEMMVRSFLHERGLRYQLHARSLRGTPDLVFTKQHIAIFVHGCFWHMHICSAFKLPSTRPVFWRQKLSRNRERDLENARSLQSLGWITIELWECELTPKSAPTRLAALLVELEEASVRMRHRPSI